MPYGAHVTSFVCEGREVLWLSDAARYEPGEAVRGGIPVIFPLFVDGSTPLAETAPPAALLSHCNKRHGFARTSLWSVKSTFIDRESDATVAIFQYERNEFPACFLEYEVRLLDHSLVTELRVESDLRNDSDWAFQDAFHTYFAVESIQDMEVCGLQGCRYFDALANHASGIERRPCITVEGAVDCLYEGAFDASGSEVLIRKPSGNILIRTEGLSDAVVWNPGEEDARNMRDFEPKSGFNRMICVEPANVRVPILMKPGSFHLSRQELITEKQCSRKDTM